MEGHPNSKDWLGLQSHRWKKTGLGGSSEGPSMEEEETGPKQSPSPMYLLLFLNCSIAFLQGLPALGCKFLRELSKPLSRAVHVTTTGRQEVKRHA